MSKKEKVICAAIKVSIAKDGYEGSCVVKGIDYKSINEDGLLSEITHPTYCNIFIQGFITSKNRFVSQKEALKITGWGNQLRFRDRKYLLPEDLY